MMAHQDRHDATKPVNNIGRSQAQSDFTGILSELAEAEGRTGREKALIVGDLLQQLYPDHHMPLEPAFL
jgi:hypothetical protein